MLMPLNGCAGKMLWENIPFIDCQDLAVFKTFFHRTQNWADLEAMQAAGILYSKKVIALYQNLRDGVITNAE